MTMHKLNLHRYVTAIKGGELISRIGKVSQFFGLVVEANGPDAFLGELCQIYSRSQTQPINAEVVGLRDGKVLLMPYGELRGIGLGSEVIATGHPLRISVGDEILGRIVDAMGKPIDGKPLGSLPDHISLKNEPLNPLSRRKIRDILETGVRAIDCFLTMGKGQRVGIFSGSGVGKSTLLGMVAKDMQADINVIALVGERGREVQEFIDKSLGPEGLKRSVIVVSTSDQPALVRSCAAYTATAIAEYFRDKGKDVLLIMDSVTRFAMAQREIGLAIGEPPTARGYTPSVFANLPKLLERCGASANGGSITSIYTVLVEGDDMNDPIADSVRSILDGHIVLSRELANHGHFPAIDVLKSISRLAPVLMKPNEKALVQRGTSILSNYEKSKDIIEIGAYKQGSNPELDLAIQLLPKLNNFLRQEIDTASTRTQAMDVLAQTLQGAGR
ncbi:flagellum-specific ATP synthase [Paucimonas lemoignei]|uniref:Flagellum-specific ATP synthase n=1 Tax=Paucimonas lemoignei TaxID=29443 RepID=A0A4R3HXZ2_PAULE|nr:FliI/YscN family ATPase [Paucimonas lemoignei]TCS37724.1 flagellum-specific ATP synthase [Paucimonas lemoignei]